MSAILSGIVTVLAYLWAIGGKLAKGLRVGYLLKRKKIILTVLHTAYVIWPHRDHILAGDIIGLIVSVSVSIGMVDINAYQGLVKVVTGESIVTRLTGVYEISHALATLVWYILFFLAISYKMALVKMYVWFIGSIIFLLLFIIGHMKVGGAPLAGLATIIDNIGALLNPDVVLFGAGNESTINESLNKSVSNATKQTLEPINWSEQR